VVAAGRHHGNTSTCYPEHLDTQLTDPLRLGIAFGGYLGQQARPRAAVNHGEMVKPPSVTILTGRLPPTASSMH
jgi:hypothetical protein